MQFNAIFPYYILKYNLKQLFKKKSLLKFGNVKFIVSLDNQQISQENMRVIQDAKKNSKIHNCFYKYLLNINNILFNIFLQYMMKFNKNKI